MTNPDMLTHTQSMIKQCMQAIFFLLRLSKVLLCNVSWKGLWWRR